MLPFFVIFSTTCNAGDSAQPGDIAQSVDTAQQQVVYIQGQLDAQIARLTAIERFLSDEALAKAGKAPKGWVPPPIDDYMKVGAPVSMIPAPPLPVASTRSSRPLGPQP